MSNLLTFKYLFAFGLSLFIISILIGHILKYFDIVASIENLRKDNHLYLIYLDQFYIKNKAFTFSCCILYVILNFLIFIFLRYISLNQTYIIPKGVNIAYNMFNFILLYLLILIILILYKSLLNLFFKKQINKFLIYFSSFFKLFDNFEKFINYDILDMFLGTLREFFYRTSTLTYRENLFPFENHPELVDDKGYPADWICDDEYDYQVENKYLIALAYFTQNFLKTHQRIRRVFKVISRILRFLHVHAYILKYYFIHFIVILCFLYDIYNTEFKTIYISLFIYLIIKLQRNLEIFLRACSYYPLNKYFYNNEIPYEKQRIFLFHNNHNNITMLKQNNSSSNLLILDPYKRKNLLDFIINKDFGWKTKDEWSMRNPYPQKAKAMYRRVYLILIFFIIYFYLYFINIYYISSPFMLLTFILLIFTGLIISHYKTFHTKEFYEYHSCAEFIYNKNYNILFWTIAWFQIYLFWSLVFYPQLIFLNTEIILDTNFLTIMKKFTIEEKVLYLFEYFDYYAVILKEENCIGYLRNILRQIDFNSLINENTSLKDIQIYIKLFIENLSYSQIIINNLASLIKFWEENSLQSSTLLFGYLPYGVLKGAIFIGSVAVTIGYYAYFFAMYEKISTLKGMGEIANNIGKAILLRSAKNANATEIEVVAPRYMYKIVLKAIKDIFITLKSYIYED